MTHENEVKQIIREDEYTFKPQPKYGKDYRWDGYPIGESFQAIPKSPCEHLDLKKQRYKFIKSNELLMPGFYSWWGISISEWPGKKIVAVKLKRKNGCWTLPPYFKDPPESPYGSQEFSGDLHTLLSCYRESRSTTTTGSKPDIYLLKGGTLRYIHENCFLIIVCTGKDRKLELKEYQPLDMPVLALNGLTDDNGKIKDYFGASKPMFHPQFLSRKESWENIAFGFYFDKEGELRCPKDKMTLRSIKHPLESCIKKKPPGGYRKFLCPNEL